MWVTSPIISALLDVEAEEVAEEVRYHNFHLKDLHNLEWGMAK